MRIGYLDCGSGASGDMLLAALLSAGWTESGLRDVVSELGVPVRITVSRVHRRGVPATRVDVQEGDPPNSRPYPALGRMLAASRIEEPLRRSALAVFARLAAVEAKVHTTPIEEVHLHELGGLDTIVDVVGVLAGFRALGLEHVVASPVNLGRGWVTIHHGTVPVPPPATAALIEGMPVYSGETEGELLTPTGAVLLATLVNDWGSLPPLRLDRIGTGAGAADPPRANVLRLFVGEALESAAPIPSGSRQTYGTIGPGRPQAERLVVLETSIDDMNPQLYPHVMDLLFGAGALDVMTIPALMKKGRPGHLLRVLAEPDLAQALSQILIAETTTLGVRIYEVTRLAVGRRRVDVETEYGTVPVKVAADPSGVLTMTPEFDACRALAERLGVPVKRVIAAAQRAAAGREGQVPHG
ncbi:MAG TPA: nickel pincer cofactor biosynthesis protein LarC [bacterium]|nr:nickel pincer cofactor biosynthesis protein LarC [bacterium]